jgi:hypothetical protein
MIIKLHVDVVIVYIFMDKFMLCKLVYRVVKYTCTAEKYWLFKQLIQELKTLLNIRTEYRESLSKL